MTATIHPCTFQDRACDTYNCRKAKGYKKYFIGRADASTPKPIFCEECMKHLVKNVPAELIKGGNELETRIRAELEAQYAEQLEAAKREFAILPVIVPVEDPVEEEIEEEVQEEKTKEKPNLIYRCLDCSKEFETAGGLSKHMRKHSEE